MDKLTKPIILKPIPFKSLEDVVKHLEAEVIEANCLHYGAVPRKLGPNVMAILRVQAASIWHYQEQMENLMKTIILQSGPID